MMSKITSINYKLYSIQREEDPMGYFYIIRSPKELIKQGFTEDEALGMLFCNENVRGWVSEEVDIQLGGL